MRDNARLILACITLISIYLVIFIDIMFIDKHTRIIDMEIIDKHISKLKGE